MQPARPLAAFHRTIMTALAACSQNLLHLEIHIELDLSRCRFPLLKTFRVTRNVHFTAAMSSFLQHHPTLGDLELKSSIISHHPVADIPFPRLVRFAGTDEILDTLVFGSSTQKIDIRWKLDFTAIRMENVLSAFTPSADSVEYFRSKHYVFDGQLLYTLPRILPHLVILDLRLSNSSHNVSLPGFWLSYPA
jgi:hypothetical protein